MYAVDAFARMSRHASLAVRSSEGLARVLREDVDHHVRLAAVEALMHWHDHAASHAEAPHAAVEAAMEHLAERRLDGAATSADACSHECMQQCHHRHLTRCMATCKHRCGERAQLETAVLYTLCAHLRVPASYLDMQHEERAQALVVQHAFPADSAHLQGRGLKQGTPEHARLQRRLATREHGLRRLSELLELGNTKFEMRLGIEKGWQRVWGNLNTVGAHAIVTLRDVLDVKLGTCSLELSVCSSGLTN